MIENSYDGDIETIYHSPWNNESENYFPITLQYNFAAEDLDYFIYYPRTNYSDNGNFRKINVYARTESRSGMIHVKSIDLEGMRIPSKIEFNETLRGVTSIFIEVISGAGHGNGFAACSEIEFYRKNKNQFNPLSLFSDETCSELKANITSDDISNCRNIFYKNLANKLYTNSYNKEFRVATYKAWMNPDIQAKNLKTSQYSLLDNPTGIYLEKGEHLVVFVEKNDAIGIGLKIQNLNVPDGDGYYNGSSVYPLYAGVNKIKVKNEGLAYVLYHSENPEAEKPVKIHFATGNVNGYFDSAKHDKDRWLELLNNANYKYFDVLGKYAHLTFETNAFRTFTPDGKSLIDQYDELVYMEAEFMGLKKYNKMFKNRHYFHTVYTGFMYATSYRTAYVAFSMNWICDLNVLKKEPWGPAHEVGHCNQTQPGLKWAGMTEVTNNIHSLYVQTQWGNQSRLISEKRYANAHREIAENTNLAHCELSEVFHRLVPFWQLYLYLVKAQGQHDFYKDLYEVVRLSDNPSSNGECQLNFVKHCIQLSKLDLIDFFDYWGFLQPIDCVISDYTDSRFCITESQVSELVQWVKRQGYKKPKHDFWEITDENIESFR